MSRNDQLAGVLGEFARTLLTDFPIQGLLDEVVRHAVDLLPIDAAGVSLITRSVHPRLLAGSDESALEYERLQSQLDEGPCRLAYLGEDPILVPDLSQETRFPRFAEAAKVVGLHAVFAFPLRSADRRVGALDLFRTSVGALDEEDQAVAQTLADVASVYLLNAERRNERSDFLASVSHELRTPMTSVAGYGELLNDESAGPPTTQQRRFVEAIVRNSRRAAALASALLVVATLDAGVERVHARVDLVAVARGAREALGPVIADRSLVVDFDLSAEPVLVQGVAEELERVLINLITNAVKFTSDEGSVRCAVWALPATATRAATARIEVSDNGLGIPRDEQAALFTRFFRSSTAEDRQIRGTGLGLTIVESIVRRHDGEISVQSAHLDGSTFTVDLPSSA